MASILKNNKEYMSLYIKDNKNYFKRFFESKLVHVNTKDDIHFMRVKLATILYYDQNAVRKAKDWFTGDTMLHRACEAGCVELVGLLLSVGAKIDTLNKKGKTPADVSCTRILLNSMDIINAVERYGGSKYMSRVSLSACEEFGSCQNPEFENFKQIKEMLDITAAENAAAAEEQAKAAAAKPAAKKPSKKRKAATSTSEEEQ